MAGQIFDVLVCCVDDFGELLAFNHLLKHVHGDTIYIGNDYNVVIGVE